MPYQILGNNDLQGDPQVNGYAAPSTPSGPSFASGVTIPDTSGLSGRGVTFATRHLWERADHSLSTEGPLLVGDGTPGVVTISNSPANPGLVFGTGALTADLYVSANGMLRTDTGFTVAGTTFLSAGGTGTGLSFFGHGANGQQVVAGAKGGNAALGSLLAALSAYGLISDTTTA